MMQSYIFNMIIGAVASLIVSNIVAFIIEKMYFIHSKAKESLRLKKTEKLLNEKGIYTLTSGSFTFNDLHSADMLFVPFPEDRRTDIEKANPKFINSDVNPDNRWHVFSEEESSINTLAKKIYECIQSVRKDGGFDGVAIKAENDQIAEIETIISDSRQEVAQKLTSELLDGQIRFNGLMFGIKNIDPTRNKVTLYRTDFFTNRVMNKVYNKLLDAKIIGDINSLDIVNKCYPLMTALGVDVLIELHSHTTMLVKRSRFLPNMEENKDMWHVSMNEAVSQTDFVELSADSAIDEIKCVKRGLKEELQIPEKAIIEDSVDFTDIYFLKDLCEIGIACTVKLKKEVTEELVRYAHYGAKDSALESREYMQTVILTRRNVKAFLKKYNVIPSARAQASKPGNESKSSEYITESCYYLFSMWLCRAKTMF